MARLNPFQHYFLPKGDTVSLVNREIKASDGGGMDSYLYQLGLVTDTGDGGMSGMSTWQYRVSNESAGGTAQAMVPAAS